MSYREKCLSLLSTTYRPESQVRLGGVRSHSWFTSTRNCLVCHMGLKISASWHRLDGIVLWYSPSTVFFCFVLCKECQVSRSKSQFTTGQRSIWDRRVTLKCTVFPVCSRESGENTPVSRVRTPEMGVLVQWKASEAEDHSSGTTTPKIRQLKPTSVYKSGSYPTQEFTWWNILIVGLVYRCRHSTNNRKHWYNVLPGRFSQILNHVGIKFTVERVYEPEVCLSSDVKVQNFKDDVSRKRSHNFKHLSYKN